MRQLLLGLSLCLAFIATAAPTKSADIQQSQQQAEIQQLKSQLDALDKELTIFKHISGNRMDMQDRRVGDLGISTNQQANYMAAISNVSTFVGYGITLIALAAGFLTYFSATRRATQEAEDAAEKWFIGKSASLTKEIEGLRQKALQAQQQVDDHAVVTKQGMDQAAADAKRKIDVAVNNALQHTIFPSDPTTQTPASPEAIQAVQAASEALESKPEIEFTADEHYVRGLSEFNAERFDSALINFEKALDTASKEPTSQEEITKFMFASAVALERLNKHEEAIKIYDQIEQKSGAEDSTQLRKLSAKALVNKSIILGQLGRNEDEVATHELLYERYGNDNDPGFNDPIARSLVNKGFALGLLKRVDEEIACYDLVYMLYGNDKDTEVRKSVAKALLNKGIALSLSEKKEEELATYDLLCSHYGHDESPEICIAISKALLNKGITLIRLGSKQEALEIFEMIDQQSGQSSDHDLRRLVATALTYRAITLQQLGLKEAAVKAYDLVVQRYDGYSETKIEAHVALSKQQLINLQSSDDADSTANM